MTLEVSLKEILSPGHNINHWGSLRSFGTLTKLTVIKFPGSWISNYIVSLALVLNGSNPTIALHDLFGRQKIEKRYVYMCERIAISTYWLNPDNKRLYTNSL